jgi:hypothetical protein
MAKTSNRNTCAPAAIIPARAPRRRLVNAKPSGSTPDRYMQQKAPFGLGRHPIFLLKTESSPA